MVEVYVATWRQRYQTYMEPLESVNYALWTLSVVIRDAIRTQGFYGALKRCSGWCDQGFALWYRDLSTLRFEETTVVPRLVGEARGVILELGPGLGNQIPRLNADAVTHVYGVEPNAYLVRDLETKLAQYGDGVLAEKYTVIACGVEDSRKLYEHGVIDESLDTVLSIQVLCSTSRPDAVARELYRLLKPGGKLIFWEHTRSRDLLTRMMQNVWNIAWSRTIGGCNMNRDTIAILRQAGRWENLETIEHDENEVAWAMLPRVWGVLTKPSI